MRYSNIYESFRHSFLGLTHLSPRCAAMTRLRKEAYEFCKVTGENYSDIRKYVFIK
jgi:hypothetical protein